MGERRLRRWGGGRGMREGQGGGVGRDGEEGTGGRWEDGGWLKRRGGSRERSEEGLSRGERRKRRRRVGEG